ncbi:MAG: hypothetical protein N2043_11675 [Ignavibacterium sp.]|nr:hypothetical protein [Ignavibacterium sp.]
MIDYSTLHEKVIHFPIAFLVLYPFVEIFYLIKKTELGEKLSFIFLVIGLLGIFFALFTGNLTLNKFSHLSIKELEIVNLHIDFATNSTFLVSIIFLLKIYFRRKIPNKIFIHLTIVILSIIVLILIFKVGEYGGNLEETLIKQNQQHQLK